MSQKVLSTLYVYSHLSSQSLYKEVVLVPVFQRSEDVGALTAWEAGSWKWDLQSRLLEGLDLQSKKMPPPTPPPKSTTAKGKRDFIAKEQVGAGGEAAARKRQKEGRILAKPTHQDSLLLCLRII